MELADTGVGVLTVCPGPVDTPFMRELFGKELVQKQKVCGSVIIMFVVVGTIKSISAIHILYINTYMYDL